MTWARVSAAPGATVSVPSSPTVISLSRVNQPGAMCPAPIELSTARSA